jgi:hypothetical protein
LSSTYPQDQHYPAFLSVFELVQHWLILELP